MRALTKEELKLVAGGTISGQTVSTLTVYPPPQSSHPQVSYISHISYVGGGGGGGSGLSPGVTHTTPHGNSYTVNQSIDDNQVKNIDKIVDYGKEHGFTNAQIGAVVNQAFYESSLGDNENGNSTHFGMFQYNTATWDQMGHSGDIHNDDDQIAAMYNDVHYFVGRYDNAVAVGAIPSSYGFENYLEVKHHLGSNSTDFNSPVVGQYDQRTSDFGFVKQ